MGLNETVCRVCLLVNGTVLLDSDLESMFHYCTMLETSKDDGLPQKLCEDCTGHLRIAYDFRSQAIYAEQYLRKILVNDMREEQKGRPTSNKANHRFSRHAPIKRSAAKHGESLRDNNQGDDTERRLSDNFSDTIEPPDVLTDVDDAPNQSDVDGAPSQSRQVMLINTSSQTQKKPVSDFQRDLASLLLENGKIECNICGSIKANIHTLKQHFLSHSGMRPFHCTICKKRFLRHSILKNHMRLHTGNMRHACDICGAAFASKISMSRHKIRDHDSNRNIKRKFTCTLCVTEHASKYALNGHMRLHLKQMNEGSLEPVPALNKGEGEIALYQKSFVDDLPRFGCMASNCDQTFERKYQLLKHLQGHADAHHLIQLCLADPSVEYLEEARMKRAPLGHNVINTNGKMPEHICGCKRKFSRKWALRLHRQMHGDHQPLSCPICPHIKQATIADLKAHMSMAHDTNQQDLTAANCKCTLCGCNYYSIGRFMHHLDRHEQRQYSTLSQQSVGSSSV